MQKPQQCSMADSLPPSFSENKVMKEVSTYVQKAKCTSSRVLYVNPQTGKTHLINYKPSRPAMPEDWRTYTIMRAYSNTLLNNLFSERSNFKMDEDKDVEHLWRKRHSEENPQNLYTWKIKLNREQTLKRTDKNVYRLLNGQEKFDKQFGQQRQGNVVTMLQGLIDDGYGPVIYECEVNGYKEYITESQKLQKYPLDLLMLTMYSGDLDEECVGPEFPLVQMTLNFDEVYRSQPVKTADQSKKTKGELVFVMYRIKSQ